jgi:hypothetical protein
MTSFLSDQYFKPKLTEIRLINKIIKEQNETITFEKKLISYIKHFILQYWQIIIIILIIIGLFYWRYKEVKNIRKKKNYKNNYINNISESENSDSSE